MPCRVPGTMPEITNRIPTTPIHVTISCSTSTAMIGSVSPRIKLYAASNDSLVLETTTTVGTVFNTTVTFSNLTSSKQYFIKYENLGQQDVNITGTISA